MRAVFSVHPEPFTLLVRGDSGIESFEGLKGKRVNVGNPGSGQRATMEVVMEAFGIGMDDFALATEYKGSEMAKQLCDGNIDAMIYTIGHPAAAIKEATTTCDVKLVDVVGAPIDASWWRTTPTTGRRSSRAACMRAQTATRRPSAWARPS